MKNGPNLIALAIPFFFLLIGVELAVGRIRRRRFYRFSDAITDLSCGISSQVVNLFFRGALAWAYIYVYENHRLVDLPPLAAWPLAFIGYDLIYYWWHRLSHEVNLLWAAHIVHHQSEDYNLAVALRQAILTAYTGVPFYLPLALLGVPPLIVALSAAVSLLYQFWIHTEAIGRMGPLEWVLNTPSHHRVHHAKNPRYLDKNYGAILIVWDRLFGTFEPETERPIYGLTKPLRSFNPLWAQFHYLFELAALSRRAPGLGEKLKVWLRGPSWHPSWAPKPGPYDFAVKYDAPAPASLRWYVTVNFALLASAVFVLLLFQDAMPLGQQLVIAALALLALPAWGALFEGRRWGLALELLRLGASAGAGLFFALSAGSPLLPYAALGALIAAALGVWVYRIPRQPAPRDLAIA